MRVVKNISTTMFTSFFDERDFNPQVCCACTDYHNIIRYINTIILYTYSLFTIAAGTSKVSQFYFILDLGHILWYV